MLSPGSRRPLLLLRSILPSFVQAALQKQLASKRYSSPRAFWTDVLTPCLFLNSDECNPERLSNRDETLLKEALDGLQLIVLDNIPDEVLLSKQSLAGL